MQSKNVISVKIKEIKEISSGIFDLRVVSEELTKDAKCGQFVNIYLNEKHLLLPRPISIADINDDEMRLIFQLVGKGTKIIADKKIGDDIKISTPLGNGYNISKVKKSDKVVLFGGGIGIPPLIYLSKTLKKMGANVICIFGYRDVTFLNDELNALGIDVRVTTDSGRYGYHGNVLDYFKENEIHADYYYACGPKTMLKALALYLHEKGQYIYVSMEERMGCGYGACVGCAIDILDENDEKIRLKVCKDGPVFDSRKVVW